MHCSHRGDPSSSIDTAGEYDYRLINQDMQSFWLDCCCFYLWIGALQLRRIGTLPGLSLSENDPRNRRYASFLSLYLFILWRAPCDRDRWEHVVQSQTREPEDCTSPVRYSFTILVVLSSWNDRRAGKTFLKCYTFPTGIWTRDEFFHNNRVLSFHIEY